MEYTQINPAETGPVQPKVKWQQNLAAVLLAISVIVPFVLNLVLPIIFANDMYPEEIHKLHYPPYILGNLIAACAVVCLIGVAANKATRTVLMLFIATYIIGIINTGLQYMWVQNPSASYYNVLSNVCSLVVCICSLYACMLLIRNNRLSIGIKSWIGVLFASQLTTIMDLIYWIYGSRRIDYLISESGNELNKDVIYSFPQIPNSICTIMWLSLIACAWIVIARCPAFSGRSSEPAPADYRPIGKYVAAAIIAPAATYGALWALGALMGA